MRVLDGADRLAAALEAYGIRHLFGMPGSQNAPLFDALRKTGITTVLSTSELAATFMANGYWRASGRLAAVAAIPGPGFAWSIPGLAEASRDNAGLLLLTGEATPRPGRSFDLQCIDQPAMSADLVRGYLRIA